MDAQTYILLAKKGPQRAIEIGKALKVSKPQLYRSLKNLESRGVVSATLEHPAKFLAIPFEKALDLLAKAKMKKALEEAQRIQESKDELLANWHSLFLDKYSDTSAKFMIIEGRNNIYARIQQMITETKDLVYAITTVPSLIRADQFGLFDVGFQHPLKSKVKFRFLTELSEQNALQMKILLSEIAQAGLNFEGRNPDLGLKIFPRMVIKDEDEILFFIKSLPDVMTTEQDNSCIWTNCKDIVHAFMGIFQQLWRNSTDIQTKIEEIENEKTRHATKFAETIKMNYSEALRLAKKEIIIMTSSEGLADSWKKIESMKGQPKGSVSVRIMAPITSENLQTVQQLPEFCDVRHIPRSALGTTIIDGKHLFQFTNIAEQENPETAQYSENIYYTIDQKYVKRMRRMLDNIWENASVPSTVTLESILPSRPVLGASSTSDITAAEQVKKNDQTRLAKSGFRGTVTIGMAVVHPPRHLNLLDMMIHVQKSTNDSDFGASDSVIFYLCLGSPESVNSQGLPGGFPAYAPLAIVSNNPRSAMMLKALYGGYPAAQNVIVAKPQQLEVWQQENMLFAGWTMPIPLLPPKYSLSPSCILFEGIGKTKHETITVNWLSGYKSTNNYDAVEAFVTFINPSSKYSGPGTDGCLRTNLVAVTAPP
jgi:sugar-specific transcriptional regulator TrmB